jgi:LCP family protein required for cell wall assembly
MIFGSLTQSAYTGRQEGTSVTSHRNEDHLPNLGSWFGSRPRHSLGYRTRHQARFVLVCALTAVLTFAGTVVAAPVIQIIAGLNNGKTSVIPQSSGTSSTTQEVVDPNAGKAIQFLILGQDTRDGDGNASIGGADDTTANLHNADTTMVAQISADRTFINLASIPRDSMVSVPSCNTSNGTVPAQYGVMFNSIFATAYQQGGDLASAATCTMNAVNSLTGLDLQNFIVVDFQGLKDMIDAIGGVDICVPVDTTDEYTGLNLTKGLQHLDGTTATQYARMRHGTGTDGSDIMRTTRQQYLIKELFSEALQKNLFTQTSQLYQLGKTALNSLNISTGLANLGTLVGLVVSLKNMDTSHLYAQTMPVSPDPSDSNRVVFADTADAFWAKFRAGQAITDQTDASSATSDQSSDAQNTDDQSTADAGTDQSTTAAATPDPTTGLITDASGQLIDPNTGGIVNPEDGSITDANTGQYIGIADRYLNATVCAVTAQN